MSKQKKLKILNAGCGYTHIPFLDVIETRLDIDKKVKPDIVLDLRKLKKLSKSVYDGVWMSHVLEHFYEHELTEIIGGIRHVLKKNGVLIAMVPDLKALFNEVVSKSMSINDIIYVSSMGPVRPRDMLYGFQPQVATGNSFYCHKTGFDAKAMQDCLVSNGFKKVYIGEENLQINAIACKSILPAWVKKNIKVKE
jgi:hypothetical protein